MDFRATRIFLPVWSVSLFCIVLSYFFPSFLEKVQYFLFAAAILTLGLPHGATDYLIYKRLNDPTTIATPQIVRFLVRYIAAMLAYLLCWLVFPTVALLFFIFISAYHFGQSNWEFVREKRTNNIAFEAKTMYVVWGFFVLGTSIFSHWAESATIIQAMSADTTFITENIAFYALFPLLGVTVLLIFYFFYKKIINKKELLRELCNVFILFFLLQKTPLLLGFAIYFSLWHALSSVLDQMRFYRRRWTDFSWGRYYMYALPYTVGAVFFLWLLVYFQPLLFPKASIVPIFFVLIACLTLPHLFLIEASYENDKK